MNELFSHGYAVIVGVGNDLPVTVEDASAVAGLLRDPNRCAYPPDQVQLLTSDRADRAHILAALDTLAEQANADSSSVAIVYFSGHGEAVPEPHLVPFGYDSNNLSGTAITGSLFTEKLRAIRAQKLLVLLDCCHAGVQASAKSPIPSSVIAELKRSSGRVVIASSRRDEKSYTGSPYSVFTAALLEALAGYGAFEKDGYARVLDVAMYVGRFVPNRTSEKQHPILSISNLEDNFALSYYAAGKNQIQRLNGLEVSDTSEVWDSSQIQSWRRMLDNKRSNLLLIQERMSMYAEYEAIPLQLIRNKQETESEILTLENNLGFQ